MINKIALIILLICTFFGTAFSQLLPSIGLNALPNDSDSICNIPIGSNGSVSPGIQPGNAVPDFKLYDLNGDSVLLSNVLTQGTPVLLISSSYTCPVFRGKIPTINMVDSIYQGLLKVYIIYTVEAHPIVDVSPYSGNVWTTSANQTQGILYEQPDTYGQRKAIVNDMLNASNIVSKVLIDGPCNPWWLNYGTHPNSATLVQTDGTVFAFQNWFHKAPLNIFCEIDSLLNFNSGQCTSFNDGGTFSLITDTIDYGSPADVLGVHGTITNLSSTENVVIEIQRGNPQMPIGWQTALCTDVCYPPTTNLIQMTLPPSGIQAFTFYFYTDNVPAQGNINVRFKNLDNSSNQIIIKYYGSTQGVGLLENELDSKKPILYPNPSMSILQVKPQSTFEKLRLFTSHGEFIGDFHQTIISTESLTKGIYLVEIWTKDGKYWDRIIKE